jgi:hypothetical protein
MGGPCTTVPTHSTEYIPCRVVLLCRRRGHSGVFRALLSDGSSWWTDRSQPRIEVTATVGTTQCHTVPYLQYRYLPRYTNETYRYRTRTVPVVHPTQLLLLPYHVDSHSHSPKDTLIDNVGRTSQGKHEERNNTLESGR